MDGARCRGKLDMGDTRACLCVADGNDSVGRETAVIKNE